MSNKSFEEKLHTLIIGGAKSGKSTLALELAQKHIKSETGNPSGLFIATASIQDQEMRLRIEAHKKERGNRWYTIEEGIRIGFILENHLDSFDVAVIDCITLWVSNILLNTAETMEQQIENLERALTRAQRPVILVSNEVGLGIVPDNKLARHYRDILGRVNQRFARLCPRVIFMAAGIPLILKGPKL